MNKTEFNLCWYELYSQVFSKIPNFTKALSDKAAGIAKKYLYPAGKVRINNTLMAINENDGTVIVFAERYEGNSGAVSVNFTTVNGTAIAGTDYVAKTGTLNWADGENGTKEITINIIDDLVFENNETRNFIVNISNPTGGLILGTPTSVVIGIRDNEIFIPEPSNKKLLFQENLQYLGCFRCPSFYNTIDEFSYGGHALAYNEADNSLLTVGHYNNLIKISIVPEINNLNLNELNQSIMIGDWFNVTEKLQYKIENTWDGAPIGGLLINNGKIIGTQYAYYSGAHNQNLSHFVVDSLDFTTANVNGLFKVGDIPRAACGPMCEIPVEWQSQLGGTHITFAADMPIIATTSSGPAAFVFNPNNLGESPTPAIQLLYYPNTAPLGDYEGPTNPIQNGTTSITGVLFVPNTNTILFFGKTGTNYSGYGTPQNWGDSNSDGVGPHSLNGEYISQIWAYDVNELIKVKNGEKQPWEIKPYSVWNFNFPITSPNKWIGGTAYDKTNKKLYICVMNADKVIPYSSLPVIHVLKINDEVTETGPKIGTLCVTPQTLVPGPIVIGTIIDFVAGNVYAKPDKFITKVEFFLDGNLIGSGTLYPTQNYKITFDSSTLAVGQHVIKAKATDNDGLTHERIINFNMIA